MLSTARWKLAKPSASRCRASSASGRSGKSAAATSCANGNATSGRRPNVGAHRARGPWLRRGLARRSASARSIACWVSGRRGRRPSVVPQATSGCASAGWSRSPRTEARLAQASSTRPRVARTTSPWPSIAPSAIGSPGLLARPRVAAGSRPGYARSGSCRRMAGALATVTWRRSTNAVSIAARPGMSTARWASGLSGARARA
mmetsp:Transcript_67683/g.220335  ORF Transcript_67683/g.220335 Transcript_67683/m.220335 type:complete len:203 (-) Transcript_67683:2551-3159(-)